jgi:DNA-binding transcriptional ArsR family regulator
MSDGPPREEASGRTFLEAITHPMRSRIMAILAYEWASAAELAAELGAPARTVRYHLRFLRERGHVSVRKTLPRRNFYEYSFADSAHGFVGDDLYASFSPAERRTFINHCLRVLSLGVTRFAAAGTTYDTHFPLTVRVRVEADEQGWQELIEILSSALEQITRVKREAGERLRAGEEDGFEADIGLLAFEAPTDEGQTPNDRSGRVV